MVHVSSLLTKLFKLKELPDSVIVIGGGIIGCEFSSVFNRLGAEVTILEYLDGLIAGMDEDLGKELKRILKKLGININTGHAVKSAKVKGDKVIVTATERKSEKEVTFEADMCLLAVGRRAYTEGLNLEAIGVQTDARGKVGVNEHLQLEGQPHIYAIGDVIRGAMFSS